MGRLLLWLLVVILTLGFGLIAWVDMYANPCYHCVHISFCCFFNSYSVPLEVWLVLSKVARKAILSYILDL